VPQRNPIDHQGTTSSLGSTHAHKVLPKA